MAFNARSDANAFCRALIANDTEEYGRRKVIQRFDTLSSLEYKCLVFAHTSKLIWSI